MKPALAVARSQGHTSSRTEACIIGVATCDTRRMRLAHYLMNGKSVEEHRPESDAASPDHDEWLLDESLEETFPASDPISPAWTNTLERSKQRPDGSTR